MGRRRGGIQPRTAVDRGMAPVGSSHGPWPVCITGDCGEQLGWQRKTGVKDGVSEGTS